jgi:mitochondrial import receptor subunit TOM40
MAGQLDSAGSLMARGQYNWIPSPISQPPKLTEQSTDQQNESSQELKARDITSATKFQAQMPSQAAGALAQKVLQLEHDHIGKDFALNLKVVNPSWFEINSSSKGGMGMSVPETFTLSGLQSVSSSVAVGGDVSFTSSKFFFIFFVCKILYFKI